MDKLAQFKQLLEGLEDSDSKTSLLSAFSNLSTDVTDTLDKLKGERKDVGSKLDGALGFKKSILESLGLDDNATTEDIQKAINSDEKTQKLLDAEKLKYDKDTKELRDLLDAEKTNSTNFKSQLDKFELKTLMEKNEMYKNVDPGMKEFYESKIMDKMLVKDGNLYIKNENGEISRNLTDNEPLSVVSLRDSILDSNPKFAIEIQKSNGGATPPSQASGNPTQTQTLDPKSQYKEMGFN